MKDGEEVASAMKDLALNGRILFRNGMANRCTKSKRTATPLHSNNSYLPKFPQLKMLNILLPTQTTAFPQNSPNFKRKTYFHPLKQQLFHKFPQL